MDTLLFSYSIPALFLVGLMNYLLIQGLVLSCGYWFYFHILYLLCFLLAYWIIWAATWENRILAYAKTKTQISFAVTAKLISVFVFATWIVQSLYFLNPKFQVSSHVQWLSSLVCVGPGRKPRRPVFWRRGSFVDSGAGIVYRWVSVTTDENSFRGQLFKASLA